MAVKEEKLRGKGWSEEEIIKAKNALDVATKHDLHFAKIIFWSALIVIILSNALISVILIPILVAMDRVFALVVIALLAGMVGYLYNFLINDIGHLQKKHHLIGSILVPVIAVVNIVAVVFSSNKYVASGPGTTHNPWVIAIVFVVAFILPYIIDRIRK